MTTIDAIRSALAAFLEYADGPDATDEDRRRAAEYREAVARL